MMNADERKIITVTCFGHFMSHFNMMVFPVLVLPLTMFYHSDFSRVINLSFLMYLFFGVSALPWGIVTDKLGPRKMLATFYAGAGGCALMAAIFIRNPTAFSLFLAGLGIFSGVYHPAGLGLISKGIREIGKGLGYNGMAGNMGLAVSPLITGLINYLWGPRAAYLFLGFFNLAGLGLLVFLKIPDLKGESVEVRKADGEGMLKAFAILCVAMMLGGIAFRGLTVTLPSLFELRNPALLKTLAHAFSFFKSHNVTASLLSSLVFLIGVFGQYAGGYIADHTDLKKAYIAFHSIALFGALGMAVFTNVLLVVIAIIYAFFLLGMQPIENTLVARYTPVKLRHAAYGAKFILTFGVGSLAVRLVGWVKETWSLQAVFYVMSLVSFCIVLTIITLILVTRNAEGN